jgi:hypothetical protein
LGSVKRVALGAALVAILGAGAVMASAQTNSTYTPLNAAFNTPGNVVIADQFNNRVIEVDTSHHIVWRFGDGSSVAGPHSVVAPNDEERVGQLTLIAGTGAPAGAEPSCPNGCPDNRVILVDRAGRIVWQYGKAGVGGSGSDELNTPVCAVALPNGDVLITDQVNERVIEVNLNKNIVWQYGTTGVSGSGPNQLNNPNSAELLGNGDVLIADENNNRVIQVNRNRHITWSYGFPHNTHILNAAAFASRVPTGDTLITDSLNNRIVEVNPQKHVVWEYSTTERHGSVAAPNPTRAVRLANGDTLVSDQFNHQVIKVDFLERILWSQGMIGVSGTGFDQLNAPYDAKVVGDYTGLTPP